MYSRNYGSERKKTPVVSKDIETMSDQNQSSDSKVRMRRVRRVRREPTLRLRFMRATEKLFGGRSFGNIIAAILLVVGVFCGILATLHQIM